MEMKFVDVDGVPTRCLTAGSPTQPAMLLIHGLTLTCDIWSRNIDVWAQDHFVVAPDMLGHGFTRPAAAPADIDIAAKVKHLLRLMRVLGAERFVACGSSYGALVAANLYLAHPDACRRLVLNGSGSCFNTEAQLVETVDRTHAAYGAALETSTPQEWEAHLRRTVFDPASIPEHLPVMLALTYAQPWIAAYWRQTVDTMRDPTRFRAYRVLERLHALAVPTLILWGREDRGAPYQAAVDAVGKMPDARLVAFEQCGHLPMLEQAEATNRSVKTFLDEIGNG